ncbi:acyl carrier protein [Streptomyces boncukensis]|uniref:Acyl carrier protein n=1 Tax=Streptomyces boncukensis TaxID=2711219 RepID=A0A6G4X2P4_9ACTN|nr:acyl carrier protein [Streptomyces boncukensis]NGO71775.1 acyl carrier protein [Streptomyces boncukensis]
MNQLTYTDLKALILACRSDLEELFESGDLSDTTFDEIDFDSLSRTELAEKINDSSGKEIPDDIVFEAATPRVLLEKVNAYLTGT